MKIVSAEEMRRIEAKATEHGVSSEVLMENAGRAVAVKVAGLFGSITSRSILVIVGPGNNGGDGLVAARYLHDAGARICVYLCQSRPQPDKNLALVQERGITVSSADSDPSFTSLDECMARADVIIDAVFGTGMSRVISGVPEQVLRRISAKYQPGRQTIVAVDLPSGLDADTGTVDPACPSANVTLTLGLPKFGLFRFPGAEKTGRLDIVDIGIPPDLAKDIATELMTDAWAGSVLPHRPLDANKGSFGKVMVIAGSANYTGAAYLACNAAARAGAGLVTLATPSSPQTPLAAKLTETTWLPLPETEPGVVSSKALAALEPELSRYNVVLIGCGLGLHPATVEFVESTLDRLSKPKAPALVVDADALTMLSRHQQWWRMLARDCVLTPHPSEMARLSGMTVEAVQADRFATARTMSVKWGKTLVLKGAFTTVASPAGLVRVCDGANPGLASAGTGDILAGVIAGLLAQKLSNFDAASCGVAIHSKAGEAVRGQFGDTGMLAGDLLPEIPKTIKGLREKTL